MPIDNCKKCNRIFQRTQGASVCHECEEESARHLSIAYWFIQNNPNLTLDEVARLCDVPYKELEAFFLEGKLGTATDQVIYRCQRCARPMANLCRRGRLCLHCAAEIGSEVRHSCHLQPVERQQPAQPVEKPAKPAAQNNKTVEDRPPVDMNMHYQEELGLPPSFGKPMGETYGFERYQGRG